MWLAPYIAFYTIKNYEILENTDLKTVVKINPAGFKASLRINSKPTEFIAFNSNYYWHGKPIGDFIDGDKKFDSIWIPMKRPTFNINDCLITAGPTLIENGVKVDFNSIEKFKWDIFRATPHTVIALTKFGKLLICYYKYHTPYQIKDDLLRFDVERAIKLDGGKPAYLKVGNIVRGTYEKVMCAVIITPN